MDRALKERIIGAIVLVVVVVLVVPVFLDGPEDPEAVVTETVPLPGQENQEVKTIILDRDRSEPVPAPITMPTPTREDDAEEPVAVAAEPEADAEADTIAPGIIADDDPPSEPERVQDDAPATAVADTRPSPEPPRPEPARAEPERAASSSTGMWVVQLGSFSNKENANRLAADLRRKGFAAFLSPVGGANGDMQRVRVGPQKDRPSAEAMAARLREAGYPGQVVPQL